MQIVIISHKKDSRQYLFSVRENCYLEKGDLVQLKTRRGITTGRCLTNSFDVSEDLLAVLAKQYNADLPLQPVIGRYFLFSFAPSDAIEPDAYANSPATYVPDSVNADTPVLAASTMDEERGDEDK